MAAMSDAVDCSVANGRVRAFFMCFYNVIRTEEGKYYTATLLFCEKDVKN